MMQLVKCSNGLQLTNRYLRRQGIRCSSARYKSPIENIKLKLATKSRIYKCQPEPLLMPANS